MVLPSGLSILSVTPVSGLPAEPMTTAPNLQAPILPHPNTSVEVFSGSNVLDLGSTMPHHNLRQVIQASAGAWDDFTRYLQIMPGVASSSDLSNGLMIRGGSPSENLYVVDGIEVPNINHISFEGSTGGFTSMIDTSSIDSVDMKAGVYDAQYSSRLSSLIDIHTRDSAVPAHKEGELNLGISGVGGFVQRPLGEHGSTFFSGHRSILNLMTNDIGINGVPVYTDAMARVEFAPNSKDSFSILSLNGGDNLNISPSSCDSGVTLTDRTQYSGLRSTTGMVWQHMNSAHSLSKLTASYSSSQQQIGQQLLGSCNSTSSTWVYNENTKDSLTTLAYKFQSSKKEWLYSIGATARLMHTDYTVSQPLGQQSPFNVNGTWTDATNFQRNFYSGGEAAYLEASRHLGTRLTMSGGVRGEFFSATAARLVNPRASLAFRLNAHQTMNATFAQSSQLVPMIYIASYASNQHLRPTSARQISVGMDVWHSKNLALDVEAYLKNYSNEPVSVEYPSLMLENMVNMLGQQFVWLPLHSGGKGKSAGVEMMLTLRPTSRIQLIGSASFSHSRFSAADGVMRPGNYDIPLSLNGMATGRLYKQLVISVRNTYTSGHPYTPFDISNSIAQSRGIYDLAKVNAVRGSAYDRVDMDLHFSFHTGRKLMTVYGGVENMMNRENLLGYVWMNSCHLQQDAQMCGLSKSIAPGIPVMRVAQMPMYPSGGFRYNF